MLVSSLLLAANSNMAFSQNGYHVVKSFAIASSGGWDYIAAGPGNNRLYVSHSTQVNVLDETTGDSVGVIPNTTGVHGIAFAPEFNKGFTSNGRLNNITVFDLKDNHVISQIATGENPDAIMYDSYSKKVITCNGRSGDLSVIDPVSEKVVATILLGGKPETAVSDEKGKIYVNIENKNEIAQVDINKNTVENHWSIAPGESPTGLAIDLKTMRLFAGCEKQLIVLDAKNGKVVDKLPIGDGCDGVAFDPEWKNVLASCGEGVMTVIREESANKYKVVENAPTERGARTITVDPKNHHIFLPTASFEKKTQPGERRPRMISGTFHVLMVAK